MPPAQYIATISKPTSWGGAIELSILAAHYGTEIASIDVETGRVDHFAPGENSTANNRAILIYSGIHYDAASLAPMPDAPDEWHQTLFPIVSMASAYRCLDIKSGCDSDPRTIILIPSLSLPRSLLTSFARRRPSLIQLHSILGVKYVKSISQGTVRTLIMPSPFQQCGQGLKGEKEARAHAEQTGHVRFGEY